MTDVVIAEWDGAASLRSHDEFGEIEDAFNQMLDESLEPRGPDALYDIVGGLDLAPGANVLDVGCGEGEHAIRLARRFGLHVLGVDPLQRHVAIGRQSLASASGEEPELATRVRFESGTAERLPVDDGSVDLVWCRDMFELVPDLDAAYAEIRRVLEPGGRALIYQMFATERLEPLEAAWLLPTMGCLPRNMQPEATEAAITDAGLSVEQCLVLGTEWGEYGQEQTGRAATKLIRAARLVRDPGRYIERFGRDSYEIALGDNLWHVYRMIGKLSDRVYVVKRVGSGGDSAVRGIG
jgi:ubiquinone/menaquinone biosynthesis C-methylase UbiE